EAATGRCCVEGTVRIWGSRANGRLFSISTTLQEEGNEQEVHYLRGCSVRLVDGFGLSSARGATESSLHTAAGAVSHPSGCSGLFPLHAVGSSLDCVWICLDLPAR